MPDIDPLAHIRARFAPGWAPSVSVKVGWHALLLELDAALVEVAPDIQYFHIGEKFGRLRVTTDDGNEAVAALIRQAEQRAATTCENCCGTGRLRQQRSWFKTLCDECAGEQGYGEVNKDVRR